MKGTELKLFQKLDRTLILETVDVNTYEEYVFHDHMNSGVRAEHHGWHLAQGYCSVNPVSSTLRKQNFFLPKFNLDSSFFLCFLRILNPFKRIQGENNCFRSKMKARQDH